MCLRLNLARESEVINNPENNRNVLKIYKIQTNKNELPRITPQIYCSGFVS